MQQKVILQDMYRCLCKYFISVIDTKILNNFNDTIEWINKKSSIKKLPAIAEAISYNHFTKEPLLYVYIRKNDDKRLPYAIGELHFTCRLTVFIIPLSKADEKDFTDNIDFNYFWEKFKHYKSVNWGFDDFSSEVEKELNFSIVTSKRYNE